MRLNRQAAGLWATVCAFAIAAAAPAVGQQANPSQPVNVVVPFPPGGFADGVARIVAEKLGAKLRQTVIVENKAGASGNLGARAVAQAAPDGNTILISTTATAINGTLFKNMGYATEDLRPVAIVGSAPEAIVVHPSSTINNLQDLLTQAKSASLNYGTAGVGTGSYIATTYLLKSLAKVDLVHVPFQGGSAAINAVIGNHVTAVALTVSPMVAHIAGGRLKALALASTKRSVAMPDVPTYSESGFPGFTAASWVGVFVPAKTAGPVVERLNTAINEMLKEPDVQERMRRFGLEPIHGNTAETAKFFADEVANWGKMVGALGMSIN